MLITEVFGSYLCCYNLYHASITLKTYLKTVKLIGSIKSAPFERKHQQKIYILKISLEYI